jgi:hypothetical protein
VFTAEFRGRQSSRVTSTSNNGIKLLAQAFDHISAAVAISQEDSTNMDNNSHIIEGVSVHQRTLRKEEEKFNLI